MRFHALALSMVVILASLALPFLATGTQAQDASRAFSTLAYAVDAQTLAGTTTTISIWGVESPHPRGSAESIRARAYLDDLIGGRDIRCLAIQGNPAEGPVRARCLNAEERDLGLQMIGAGLVAVSRRDVNDSELASAYIGTEREARAAKRGLWRDAQAGQPGRAEADATSPLDGGVPIWAIAGALLVVPLLGFLIVGVVMSMGFRQLITLQRYQIAGTQKRERQLKEREKYVIASALESELITNRSKLDAYIIVHDQLLKALRDPTRTPKYQRGGELIQDKPPLTRSVFDAHIDKLELLGPQIATDIANLYALIVSNPEYRTIEPDVPIEKAREMVDKVIRNAERLIEPMDKVSGALAIIVRDKRGAMTTIE